MSEFDRYLERLRERAGITIDVDAERELRTHFEEAVASQLKAGSSPREAELAALDELGKPEVVAAAFRAERRALRRLAGGPGTSQVETSYPILPGAAAGAIAGAGGFAALKRLRKRRRR